MSYYEKIPVIIEAWEMTKNNIIEDSPRTLVTLVMWGSLLEKEIEEYLKNILTFIIFYVIVLISKEEVDYV